VQKKGSKLMPWVTMGDTAEGEGASPINQFGETKANVGETSRNSDTPNNSVPRDRRWVFPTQVDWGTTIDNADMVRQMLDPTSPLTEAGVMAMGRAIDEDIIIPSFFGAASVGQKGATTVTFPSSNVVGVQVGSGSSPANVGMNKKKLLAARKLFRQFYVDFAYEPLCVGITAEQEENLLDEIEITSTDYRKSAVLETGDIGGFLRYNFVVLEEWPVDANGFRECPVWVKSGINLTPWKNAKNKAGEDAGKRFNNRLYMERNWGATRTQEPKVLKILCAEQ
jgi:hypothetical protein